MLDCSLSRTIADCYLTGTSLPPYLKLSGVKAEGTLLSLYAGYF